MTATPANDIHALAANVLAERHIPIATYRLQFHAEFGFQAATALVPYLHALGISDIYASPLLKPRAGSTHGYDVSDHSQLNPALGTSEDFAALVDALHAHDMGLMLDMVPNHMGIDDESNGWWLDVLENGPASIYAHYFDIDWHPVKPELRNKVLLPILGDQYGNVLESGQLRLIYDEGAVTLRYYEHLFPIAPRTYDLLLNPIVAPLSEELGEDHDQIYELRSIITAISYLPSPGQFTPDEVADHHREKEVIKRRLGSLTDESPAVRDALQSVVEGFNGTAGDPASFDLLDTLINRQSYRLAFWRVAAEEINYRRFFDINDLAAIRVEEPEVFHATHDLIFELLSTQQARGLRIDHPDGLWDPPGYFRQLQTTHVARRVAQQLGPEATPDELPLLVEAWFDEHLDSSGGLVRAHLPLYVLAEKILAEHEQLPIDWALHGTTGYDFLNDVNGLLVDTTNARAFNRLYQQFIGRIPQFDDLVNTSKKRIMLVSLESQIYELSYFLERIAESNRRYRDFTLNSLTFALREVIACLPVYRTYVTEEGIITQQDQEHVNEAVRAARRRNPRTAEAVFAFIRESLLLQNIDSFAEHIRPRMLEFVMKFQQLTGPVMAKGLEDTAFYVYNRLAALNEVGGHPEHFGLSLEKFHERTIERRDRFTHAMLTTSTHDTKRSEDVRTRISVLSELPEEWRAALGRWSRTNAPKKTALSDGTPAPVRNDEYLLYQTLLGTWNGEPLRSDDFATFRERIADYMQKAINEAKEHTSWVNPNEEYNAAMRDFVLHVLDGKPRSTFLKDLLAFQRRISYYGQFNALSQLLLKLTTPGVPDIYQGTELWDFSLVDPDNRRPVDYALRQRILDDLHARVAEMGKSLLPLARELLDDSSDGRIKLYLISRTLNFRREQRMLFQQGSYEPLLAVGELQEHVCAFARRWHDDETFVQAEMIVVVPRLIATLTGRTEQTPLGARIWKETLLPMPHAEPGARYRNLFTGELLTVRAFEDDDVGLLLGTVLAHFPVAVLVRE